MAWQVTHLLCLNFTPESKTLNAIVDDGRDQALTFYNVILLADEHERLLKP